MWQAVVATVSGGGVLTAEVEGICSHGDPDPGVKPIYVGSRGVSQTPAAVDEDDCVRQYFTLEGRGVVLNDLLNAGEDLVNDVLAIVEEPLAVEQHSLDLDRTATALENSRIVKAAPGRLYETQVIVDTGINADRFVHLLNQTTAPVGGETPLWRALLPANALHVEVFFDLRPGGIYSDTGIVVAISDVLLTYSAPGNVEGCFHIGFK